MSGIGSLLRDQQHAVDLVDLDELHLDPLAGARWAGSCRRSRGGSAARGGRGRRGRRAGRARGGRSRTAPRSRRGSCGPCRGRRRRGCRSSPRAGSRARVARTTGWAWSGASPPRTRDVVAVEGDVDGAERRRGRRCAPRSAARSRWASGTPRVWIPTSATSSSSGLRSMISCAIRESVRSSASRRGGAWRPKGAQTYSSNSFPASLDRVKGNRARRRLAARADV